MPFYNIKTLKQYSDTKIFVPNLAGAGLRAVFVESIVVVLLFCEVLYVQQSLFAVVWQQLDVCRKPLKDTTSPFTQLLLCRLFGPLFDIWFCALFAMWKASCCQWMWCSAVIIIMGITMMIVRCIDGIDAKLIKEILNYKFNLMIRIILPQKEWMVHS